jgi:hypothetical protein
MNVPRFRRSGVGGVGFFAIAALFCVLSTGAAHRPSPSSGPVRLLNKASLPMLWISAPFGYIRCGLSEPGRESKDRASAVHVFSDGLEPEEENGIHNSPLRDYGFPFRVRPLLHRVPASRGFRDNPYAPALAQLTPMGLWRDARGGLWCGGACGEGQACCSFLPSDSAPPRPRPSPPPPTPQRD